MNRTSTTGIKRIPIITRNPIMNIKRNPIIGGKFPDPIKEWLNNEFGAVHTVQFQDEIWFGAAEIANILGYTNPHDAISKHVDAEDKISINLNTLAIREGIPKRGNPNRVFINQFGLHCLIL